VPSAQLGLVVDDAEDAVVEVTAMPLAASPPAAGVAAAPPPADGGAVGQA
jgi:hypothetical protein